MYQQMPTLLVNALRLVIRRGSLLIPEAVMTIDEEEIEVALLERTKADGGERMALPKKEKLEILPETAIVDHARGARNVK
jgi:hypothetical protein